MFAYIFSNGTLKKFGWLGKRAPIGYLRFPSRNLWFFREGRKKAEEFLTLNRRH
jgi:hypothetical protein